MGSYHGDTSCWTGSKGPRSGRQGRHRSVRGLGRNAGSSGATAVLDYVRTGGCCNRGCRLPHLECDAGARGSTYRSSPPCIWSGRTAEPTPRLWVRGQLWGKCGGFSSQGSVGLGAVWVHCASRLSFCRIGTPDFVGGCYRTTVPLRKPRLRQ